MQPKSIQDILPLVELPSRYLGTEINSIHKDHSKVKLKFLLAFPDIYEIGTAHFGIQILYHLLNRKDDVVAERVYAPAADMVAQLKAFNIPLCALESGFPAQQFDVIGFSLLYELNFTNVLNMMDLAGIPFRFKDRNACHPIIIAGGPCTSNPEPMADFFDAMVIGDGETVLMEMISAWMRWKNEGSQDKTLLLRSWAAIDGVYIPSFYTPSYDTNGHQRLHPVEPDLRKVKRAIMENLDTGIFPEKPVVPFGRPIHDRLRLEVGRGCTRGCRFCQAGMIYRPVRERSLNQLIQLSEKSLDATGYEDLSLLSLSISDYSCIGPLLEQLMVQGEADHVAVSFPSFRAGTIDADIMALVKKVRKTGFTIAAEAGSQRLRDVINKNIREEDIISTVESAFQLGWQVIKLYFMIGLPTETEEDLSAMVGLVKTLLRITGPAGRRGKINISVNTFIPKPHTPFQWSGQLSLEASKRKIEWLKQQLFHPRVQFKWQNPESSLLEGLFARGDRRLSRLVETAYQKGCQFDGWSDQFKWDKWIEAAEESGVDLQFYTTRERDFEEPLPWDHIDVRVEKDFLHEEWEKSKMGELTPDCRQDDCQSCGVCDFKQIEPKVFIKNSETVHQTHQAVGNKETPVFFTYRILYSKQGRGRFFGHLELVNILLRAIRRAKIPIKYSEGFHPLPKVSFDDPLPLGMESSNESFTIIVPRALSALDIRDKINAQLPEGLNIHDVQMESKKKKKESVFPVRYLITLVNNHFDEMKLQWFNSQPDVMVNRSGRKGDVQTVDLKRAIEKIEIVSPEQLDITLIHDPGNKVRPPDILLHLFRFDDDTVKRAVVSKIGLVKSPFFE